MVTVSTLHARTFWTRWLLYVVLSLLAAAAGLMLMLLTSPSPVKAEAAQPQLQFQPKSPGSPTAAEEQDRARVAYNSTDNQYLVVWEDDRNFAATGVDIYGQRVSVDGTLLGSPFPISTAASHQDNLAVAYNSTGNEYLVVWEDDRAALADRDLYGQRVSGAGALLGGEITISTAAGRQSNPAVAYNSTGNEYLVVWEDVRTSNANIYGQRVSGAGALAGGEIPISTAADDQTNPAVAYNSTGNEYLVVWEDDRSGTPDLYGQRVSGAGALVGGEIPISTVAEDQTSPAVAYNSTGNEYLVVWEDNRPEGGAFEIDIYGQRLSGAGALLGGEIPISTAADFQYYASVAYSSTGNQYLVVWSDYRYSHCGSMGEIYGQRVSGAGAFQGSNFNITPDPPCTLKFADVPPSGEGSTFYTFIHFLTCKGIVSGYPCGGAGEACNAENEPYYRPGANVTRGQLSKIIANSAGLSAPIPQGQQQFADVPPGSPFYEFVERLAATGAISGYPCGGAGEECDAQNRPYFRPNNPATRGQISKIVATAAGFDEEVPAGQQTFTDVSPSSPFWVYIERLAAREVISGYSDAARCPTGAPCFRYNDNTTRGQMAKIAANAFFPGCQVP